MIYIQFQDELGHRDIRKSNFNCSSTIDQIRIMLKRIIQLYAFTESTIITQPKEMLNVYTETKSAELSRGRKLGAWVSYLHGILDGAACAEEVLVTEG